MTRVTTWQEIREFDPPPSGVPLQIRCEFARPMGPIGIASIVLPLMFNGTHWRHVNRSPEEYGAWLHAGFRGAMFRPTHWQHFADPDLPAPVYRVIERAWNGPHLSLEVIEDALTFEAARALVEARRRGHAWMWAEHCDPRPGFGWSWRETVIERMADADDGFSPALAGWLDQSLEQRLADLAAADDDPTRDYVNGWPRVAVVDQARGRRHV
ncbi:MAG: hypothetical protein K2Y51_06370 [Gammaproteobacteria bacterium]|nr:hypothetical protein [Gammaproteobacteria bacterium]